MVRQAHHERRAGRLILNETKKLHRRFYHRQRAGRGGENSQSPCQKAAGCLRQHRSGSKISLLVEITSVTKDKYDATHL